MKINSQEALDKLEQSGKLFQHGTLSVEVYQPDKVDYQKPHDRDEIYVVIAGSGTFYCDGEHTPFGAGDFLFVPAFVEHRTGNFTTDFSTWVFFYGPKGGES